MKRQNGFTLIEMMIALVVVAILAAVAIPSYNEYVTRGKFGEATSTLADMRIKLEQYFQDNRTYVGACVVGTVAPLPLAAATRYFDFTCPTLTATTFTVQASGRAAVRMDGFVYTIDQANVQATTITAATTAANNGWTGNATCWVIRKGGSCS